MSRAFRFLVRAREKLYQSGILATYRLQHPVISVGNLTLGGTGKTPLVIALAEGLRDRGFKPVILSRGYGRTSRRVVIVDIVNSNYKEAGDEPLLMKRHLRDVPVVVAADRYQAGLTAEQRQLGNVFLLDDGFQHRRLHRNVDIVAIDPVEWAEGESLLPTGRWREPKSAVARAQAACVLDVPGAPMPDVPVPLFTVKTVVEGLFTHDGVRLTPEEIKGRTVVAFAGIAKPERFFATVRSLGIEPAENIRFADHHRYTAREIGTLDGDILLTTEKDAVRLYGLTQRSYCYIRISAKISPFDELMALILDRIR